MSRFIPPHILRQSFANMLSQRFQREVPEYSGFVALVRRSNEAFLNKKFAGLPIAERKAAVSAELDKVMAEKHGAIRLGKDEASMVRRVFAVLGMNATNFYDLTGDKIPVTSTAFRDKNPNTLIEAPFRVFTSVLKTDDLSFFTEEQQVRVDQVLSERKVFLNRERLMELVKKFEKEGGLEESEAKEFVKEAVDVFATDQSHIVDFTLYQEMLGASDVAADIAALGFRPVIIVNHLTPKVFDIEQAFKDLQAGGFATIPAVQGPPKREGEQALPLLNQTSIKSAGEYVYAVRDPKLLAYLKEHPGATIDDLCKEFKIDKKDIVTVDPDSADQKGLEYLKKVEGGFERCPIVMFRHKARFGEIESRGVALTPHGRETYDRMVDDKTYTSDFPKTHAELFANGFAYYQFSLADDAKDKLRARNIGPDLTKDDLRALVEEGVVILNPITFEDFLPKSAAGIFRSNLSNEAEVLSADTQVDPEAEKQRKLEEAFGVKIQDSYALYEAMQQQSFEELVNEVRVIKGVTSPASGRQLTSLSKGAEVAQSVHS
jgi:uncharacterized glyoxalase superfamily metalloenzyme YdcJ